MIKTVSFTSNKGSLGNMINDFLKKQQFNHKENFKLIDIKYSIGEHNVDEYYYEGALVIYDISEKKDIL